MLYVILRRVTSSTRAALSGDDLGIDLVVTSARLVRYIRRTAQIGDSVATWRALAILQEHGPVRIGEFAELDSLTQPAATAMLRRLVEEGLADRIPDPDDGRASLLQLSAAGTTRLLEMRDAAGQATEPLLAGLDQAERDRLAAAMDTLAERLRAVTTAPPSRR